MKDQTEFMFTVNGKEACSQRVNLCLAGLLFGIVAVTFFSRIWDPDFFWHLATGRWITQNLALPDHDPFTPFFYGTEREALILKGYWLTQVGYQLVDSLAGTFGQAILKSATFVAIFSMVFQYHRRQQTPLFWVFLALLPLYETFLHFRADRPNMFSFLFFAVLLYLLEKNRWKMLPLLMLVWANVHGGYLLGDVVIILYLGVFFLRQRQDLPSVAIGWGVAAVAASFVNPLGMTPLLLMLKFEGSAYQQGIYEFYSPLRIALQFHDYYIGYFLALLLVIGTLLACRKYLRWEQAAILLLTAVISLLHARYMPFFVIAGAHFLPQMWRHFSLSVLWQRLFLFGSTALISILFIADLADGRALTYGLEPGRFPERAAAFVATSRVTGRVFCNDVWGGYLLWKLPDSTVLSDTRALSEDVHLRNSKIAQGNSFWERDLLALDAKMIVVSAFDPITGRANRLWQPLSYSPNWQLAYADNEALVYFRKDAGFDGERSSLDETRVRSLDHALAQIRALTTKYPQTAGHWGDLGQIYFLRGETKEAVQAYRQALNLDPGNTDVQSRLKILESQNGAPAPQNGRQL